MAKPTPLNLRVDETMFARIDVIAAALSQRAEGAEVTRSDAARIVLGAGLPIIEARLGLAPTPAPEEAKSARKPAKKTAKK